MRFVKEMKRMLTNTKGFHILKGEEGMGVVEVILIIVVLIGLVIIFQTNIKAVVASIFATIEKNASSVQ